MHSVLGFYLCAGRKFSWGANFSAALAIALGACATPSPNGSGSGFAASASSDSTATDSAGVALSCATVSCGTLGHCEIQDGLPTCSCDGAMVWKAGDCVSPEEASQCEPMEIAPGKFVCAGAQPESEYDEQAASAGSGPEPSVFDTTNLPSKVDHRADYLDQYAPTISDQGACGWCVAHAVTQAIEAKIASKKNSPAPLISEPHLWSTGGQLTNQCSTSWKVEQGMIAATQAKLVPLEYWPYEKTAAERAAQLPTPAATLFAQGRYRVASYGKVSTSQVDQVKAALASDRDLVISVPIFTQSGWLVSDGLGKPGWLETPPAIDKKAPSCKGLPVPKTLAQKTPLKTCTCAAKADCPHGKGPTGVATEWSCVANRCVEATHAILVVGYDDSSQTLLFRNSWGASFGDGGYGHLPYAYIAAGGASPYGYYVDQLLDCEPHAAALCGPEGNVVWKDSCGDMREVKDACPEPCAPGSIQCVSCQPQVQKGCDGSNLVWFDSCGKPTIDTACQYGCDSALSACKSKPCTANTGKVCSGAGLHWTDSCGNLGALVESCQYGCSGGACLSPTCSQLCGAAKCGTVSGCACGSCPAGFKCNSSTLQCNALTCSEKCVAKSYECGSLDGCSCGICGGSKPKCVGNHCEALTCAEICSAAGKKCGSWQGCSCGSCAIGSICQASGTCCTKNACGTCGAVPTEICWNNKDDDCNGKVDDCGTWVNTLDVSVKPGGGTWSGTLAYPASEWVVGFLAPDSVIEHSDNRCDWQSSVSLDKTNRKATMTVTVKHCGAGWDNKPYGFRGKFVVIATNGKGSTMAGVWTSNKGSGSATTAFSAGSAAWDSVCSMATADAVDDVDMSWGCKSLVSAGNLNGSVSQQYGSGNSVVGALSLAFAWGTNVIGRTHGKFSCKSGGTVAVTHTQKTAPDHYALVLPTALETGTKDHFSFQTDCATASGKTTCTVKCYGSGTSVSGTVLFLDGKLK